LNFSAVRFCSFLGGVPILTDYRQGLVHNRPNASVWDNYAEVKVIGHGMTGKVYMVQHKSTKEKYALKVSRRILIRKKMTFFWYKL
jgi:serine/threonine protein kinase